MSTHGDRPRARTSWIAAAMLAALSAPIAAQLPDKTVTPNTANEGIGKSYAAQIGGGHGDLMTPNTAHFNISRDPFRAIRRGRQLFQRKFTRAQGVGPLSGDGTGNIETNLAIGAGLSDSCASCHGRPRGSAGFGGDVATRPDSRDAPHLFGLGLKEMLADEITADLRDIRKRAIGLAMASARRSVTLPLVSKGIDFGAITARWRGSVVVVDTSRVRGVDPDLRVRPFFAHGGTISIREFVVGALNAEMGMQAVDPDLRSASLGATIVTPAGMVLDGAQDRIEAPPAHSPLADPDGDGVANEVPECIVDYLEFYLLNYFKPGVGERTPEVSAGRHTFSAIGCDECHVSDLRIESDRRVADVETAHDPVRGSFNRLFATAAPRFTAFDDGSGHPAHKRPSGAPFDVAGIYTDFKRHDLGPGFHELNYDGTWRREFLTTPLWGVGSTPPYGHDGRSINLAEAILRHGGEAQLARDAFAGLSPAEKAEVLAFLSSLVLFPPDDTASNLDPGNPLLPEFPQMGHGSIRLAALFNNPLDPE